MTYYIQTSLDSIARTWYSGLMGFPKTIASKQFSLQLEALLTMKITFQRVFGRSLNCSEHSAPAKKSVFRKPIGRAKNAPLITRPKAFRPMGGLRLYCHC
jgi:hypothetical protein